MSDEEWVVFDGDNYEKRTYEVRMPDGDIVRAWPNAGTLHIFANQGKHSGKVVDPDGVIAIRKMKNLWGDEDSVVEAARHVGPRRVVVGSDIRSIDAAILTQDLQVVVVYDHEHATSTTTGTTERPPQRTLEEKQRDFGRPVGMRSPVRTALAAASMLGGGFDLGGPRRTRADCTHSFGYKGGFSSCSACGKLPR